MNNSFYIISFLLILGYFQGQSQSLGFEQSECSIISNSFYYIDNYQVGTHGSGYRLYHNGIVIAEESSSLGGYTGEELRFIDDTTGFFIVLDALYSNFEIYKIIDEAVILIGTVPGIYYDFYIVSRHTLYFASNISPPNTLFISRLSDILPQKYIVYFGSLVSDTTVVDTIVGVPFCPNLNEINYRYKITNDTLIYTILFSVDTLLNSGKEKTSDITIYPNPAKEFIRIKTTQNENQCSIHILDNLGMLRKSIVMNHSGEIEILIGDLNKGIYFIVLDNTKTTKVYKLIKI